MVPSGVRGAQDDALEFLAGGGEMERRIRAFNWTQTPLGPPAQWPQSLKTALKIALNSRYPIWMGWGPTLINLYNTPYIPVLGKRDEWALGAFARDVWKEIWAEHLGPQAEAVLLRGEASWNDQRQMVMYRNGYPEETYFTFSFSPLPADGGGIGGLFCTCTEDTQKVLGERRLATLRQLSAAAADARTVEDASRAATRVLAEHSGDLSFGLIYLVDQGGGAATLAAATPAAQGAPWAPGRISLAAGAQAPWPLRKAATGTQVLRDMPPALGLPGGCWPEPATTAVLIPLAQPGHERLRGFLVAGASPRLPFDANYESFFELLGSSIAAMLSHAQACEDEKRRAEALAELDRAKTRFFSNVSHEFRTPLTLMLGPVEDMLANRDVDLARPARAQLEIVQRNSLRLLKLVNTLLDFSRIEAGRMRASYEPVDLPAYTAELASVFRAAIERAGMQLWVHCPPLPEPAYVDRDMWEKIVLNLLSNAFKFTLEGGIEVRMEAVGGGVQLAVRDTGVGIPAEELPRMFERFHRVQSPEARTHEGAGIGLALVQELVKLHGGSVRAESTLGLGSTFLVHLPLGCTHLDARQISQPSGRAAIQTGANAFVEEALRWLPEDAQGAPSDWMPALLPAAPAPAGQPGGRPRVLLADDNADMRDYVKRLLMGRFEVEAVPDGLAALEAARARAPALVLSDVMMPRLDGFGLLRALRADAGMKTLPVILLSARAGEEARVEGIQAGADDYLIKPFSARELLARVESHVKMASFRREAGEALRLRVEQFETLLNKAPLGVYLVDADLRIREVNPVALPVFGDIPGGVAGQDFDAVVHRLWEKDYADEIVRIFRHTLETGEPYRTLERGGFRIDRGITEHYEWRTERMALPDGRYGVVCYFQDISVHVAAREALREADRRKDEFLATLAHELRNPLAPIRNSLEIVKRAGHETGLRDNAIGTMERQLRHMVRLVDDLLDVSRISRGMAALQRKSIELGQVVQMAVEGVRPQCEASRIELRVELPPTPVRLFADPTRLAQVLGNLLGNACKFTAAGGRVELGAQVRGGALRLWVRDTGIGILQRDLARIFEMFTQVDSSLERRQGGLGIGLTLVRQLVHLHGGTVHAHSEGKGRGSEFVVELPLPGDTFASAGDSEGSLPITTAVTTPHRILIVDDNGDAADSLARLLQMDGYEVLTAYDGAEGLEMAARTQPGVVLLDIGLPKLNGYEVARRIRQQRANDGVHLVALTGLGQAEDRRRSEDAHFDAHLVKPVEPAVLERLLASLLGGQ